MSVTCRRNDPVRPRRTQHAFEFRTTAFGDKWTADLALLGRIAISSVLAPAASITIGPESMPVAHRPGAPAPSAA
jgi:hypothetical protein